MAPNGSHLNQPREREVQKRLAELCSEPDDHGQKTVSPIDEIEAKVKSVTQSAHMLNKFILGQHTAPTDPLVRVQ